MSAISSALPAVSKGVSIPREGSISSLIPLPIGFVLEFGISGGLGLLVPPPGENDPSSGCELCIDDMLANGVLVKESEGMLGVKVGSGKVEEGSGKTLSLAEGPFESSPIVIDETGSVLCSC